MSDATTTDPVREARASSLRLLVTFNSLSFGQIVMGERDAAAVVKRAAVGAALTEGTARFIQFAQSMADLDAPIDPLILASYGERELTRIRDQLLAARLAGRIQTTTP